MESDYGEYEKGNLVVVCVDSKEDNQKFTINKNGTISPLKAQNLVVGMDATTLEHDRLA